MPKPIRQQIINVIKNDIQEFINHNRNNIIASAVEQIDMPQGMENADFTATINRCIDNMVEYIERKIE